MVPTAMRTGLGCFSINNVFSLFLFVLLNLGCFVFCNTNDSNQKKKQKLTSISPSPHSPARLIKDSHNKSKSSTWDYIKSVFTKINKIVQPDPAAKAIPVLTSARSSHRSLVQLDQPPHQDPVMELHHQQPADMMTMITTDNSSSFFSQRNNDIYPCTACGQIFHKTQLLEHHQTVNHALSELTAEDPGRNIVKIIFKSSWTTTYDDLRAPPRIHRILKIHNSPKVLYRFEEYRELVKSKASAARSTGIRRPRDERCIADGNELLRFHCSTFMCQQLGQDGNSTLCSQPFCSVCGIIRYGFSAKLDGISTMSTSWRAHMSIPDEILEEFQFMNVKRAMLLCRVVAGRIGTDDGEELCEKSGEGGFDSVFGQAGSGALTSVDEEELLVFNPRAVLPCFVIVYTV